MYDVFVLQYLRVYLVSFNMLKPDQDDPRST